MHPSNLFFILAALAASSMAQDVIPSTIADSIPTHETNAIDTVSVGGGSTGVGPVSLPSGIQTDSETLPTISGSVAPS
ncbi:hypothetical protein K7432_016495 [Basidiobolus ranarum]|uniref:Uncharacterized protein n=1 Tax=Basidiobolus ranarum TaxID=34480 RepID=A0ABR2VLI6_9FUNG